MKYPQRKNIRMEAYDYSQVGGYFITICTEKRKSIFMETRQGIANLLEIPNNLTKIGSIAERHLLALPQKYPQVTIDKYVIMPNHLHFILIVAKESGRAEEAPTTRLGQIIAYYKYQTSKECGAYLQQVNLAIWQRGYHDHIIRSEEEYQLIWEYIDTNQLKWEIDKYYSVED